jgi:hypothetical protein
MTGVTGRGLVHLLDDVRPVGLGGPRRPALPGDGTFDPEQHTAIRP